MSSLNIRNKTVTVEWYERGESKGKEIDFKTIFSLNPVFAPKEAKSVTEISNEIAKPVQPVVTNQNSNQNVVNSRQTLAYKPAEVSKIIQPTAVNSRVPTTSRIATGTRIPPPPLPPLQPPPVVIDEDDRTETDPIDAGNNDKKGNKGTMRKSNCVKEVERIQQRRDERRAAQKAIKDQPEYDPSNPNYDFLMMIRDFQENLDYNPLTNTDPIEYHQICVCLRKRPLNKRELGRKEIDVVTIPNKQTVYLHEPKLKVDLTKYLENQQFRFDYAFDETSDNAVVYRYTAKPLVECIFEKGMATCFAYGQTGSGKTHTMGGEFQGKGIQNYSGGIYALAANDVFHLLNHKYKHEDLIVQCAFFEIYGGKVFDLLNKKEKLRILEDAKSQVQIVGLKTKDVHSVDDVLNLLQIGNMGRTSGQTSANAHSSRSHAVFQIILKKRATNRLWGKFSLIDLAGNERGADTSSSDRNTRMEGAEINKSLLALKECIRALGRKGAHRPFRASKLTQVLRDSFIGTKSRTCMISMISPGLLSCEHTLNTLRYADRVKELGPGGNSGDDAISDNAQQQHISGSGDYENNYNNQMRSLNISNNNNNNNPHVNQSAGPMSNISEYANEQYPDEDDDENMELENGDDDDEDDLALLRSANADFIDEEMYNFQELVNKIEEMEDTVCEKHKNIVDKFPTQLKKHSVLFKMTKQVDYALDDYAVKLEELLEEQIDELVELREKVSLLRSELKREEEISNKLLQNRNNL